MLTAFRTHWWGEVNGDLDAAMSVLPANSIFWAYTPFGASIIEHSAEGQRTLYQTLMDAGMIIGASFQDERWAFGEWGMMLEAVWLFVLKGSFLSKLGSFEPEQVYVVKTPCLFFAPYLGSGLLGGEITYASQPLSIEPVEASMVDHLLGRSAPSP
jgi:hypothetical protein